MRASRRRGAASTRTEIRSPQDPLWKICGDVGAASPGTGTGPPQDPPCRNWGDVGPHPRQEPGLLKTRCGCFGRTRGRASVFLLRADSVPAASSRGWRSGSRCPGGARDPGAVTLPPPVARVAPTAGRRGLSVARPPAPACAWPPLRGARRELLTVR